MFLKKLSYKRYSSILIISTLSILLINSVFLYTTDAYSIIDSTPKQCYSVPNERYLITEYILNNKEQYDSFIFGSSRVGSINPLIMKDKSAYNMTYGEGLPHEHLLIIKLFIKNNISIKHLLIGLDDFSPRISFNSHQSSFMPKSHYLATGESAIDFYQFYFFRKPKSYDIEHFKKKFLNYPYRVEQINSICKKILIQETTYPKHKTTSINDKLEKSTLYSPVSLKKQMTVKKDTICFNNTLEDIKEIVDIADEHNIDLIFYINPINHLMREGVNIKFLNEFKDELSYITPFYDFTIPNKISNDNNYWIDLSHFKLVTGDLILNRIFDNNTSIKDFGIYIEKKEKN